MKRLPYFGQCLSHGTTKIAIYVYAYMAEYRGTETTEEMTGRHRERPSRFRSMVNLVQAIRAAEHIQEWKKWLGGGGCHSVQKHRYLKKKEEEQCVLLVTVTL